MQLTVFQKIGLVGIGLIVIGGLVFIVLPQLLGGAFVVNEWLSFVLFSLGGVLLWAGILGNLILVIYRAGAEGERRRLGLPPTNR